MLCPYHFLKQFIIFNLFFLSITVCLLGWVDLPAAPLVWKLPKPNSLSCILHCILSMDNFVGQYINQYKLIICQLLFQLNCEIEACAPAEQEKLA